MIKEINKYLETKENGKITYQNLWDTAKAILTGKFIIRINAYMKKQDKSQINKLLRNQWVSNEIKEEI